MEIKRKVISEKIPQGYKLQIVYLRGREVLHAFYWPVTVQQTPKYLKRYITKQNLEENLADSLRMWYYCGYSIKENGFFIGPEFGSELSFVDAFRFAQTGKFKEITPFEFYLISRANRPHPGALKERVPTIRRYMSKHRTSPMEGALLWQWAYEGHSIYSNPGNGEMDYITWLRDKEPEERWDNYREKYLDVYLPEDNELPF